MADLKSSITIDLIVKGLERIEKIGKILGSLVLNSKFTNGFNLLYNALGSVSAGAQKALGTLGKFAVLISAISSNPQFKQFAQTVADALKQINSELGQSVTRTKSSANAWKQFSMGLGIVSILIRSVGFLIRDLGLNLLRTSQRIGSVFKKLIDGGSEIEQKFSELQGLLGFQNKFSDDFRALSDEIVRVGEVSSQTISQVAGLATELARAGFSAKEITQSIAGVVQLAEAAGLSAEQAATIAANVKTMFNLQASELSRVNDVLTQTANASTSSVQSLGESFTYVGPLASAFGFSVEEVAGALGVLANAGQRGSVAGAGLQQMFSQLVAHSDDVDAVLKRYGRSFQDVNPQIHSVTEIMKVFQETNISTADVIDIFSERARKTFLALKSQGQDTLEMFIEMNRNANGLAKSIAETRMDNVSGDILRMKSAFEALTFEVFQIIADDVRNVVQSITSLIQSIRNYVSTHQDFIGSLADAISKLGALSFAFAGFTLAASSATRTLGLIVGALATVTASFTLLGSPLTSFIVKVAAASKYTGFMARQLGVLSGIFVAAKVGILAAAKAFGIFLLSFASSTVVLGLIGGLIAGVIYHWDMFSSAVNAFYYDTWLPAWNGIVQGFKEGYEAYIKPSMESIAEAFSGLAETISSLFGDSGATYTSFQSFGKLLAYISAGFIEFVAIIIRSTSGAVKAVMRLYEGLKWIYNLIQKIQPADLDFHLPAVEQQMAPSFEEEARGFKSAAQVAAGYRNEIRQVIEDQYAFTMSILKVADGLSQSVPLYEKAGSLLSRLTQLQPNELKEFETTIAQLSQLGKEFTLEGVTEELNKLQGDIEWVSPETGNKFSASVIDMLKKNVDSIKKYMDSPEFGKALADMGAKGGAQAYKERFEEMLKQNQKLLEDYTQKRDKLLQAQRGFDLIKLVTGSESFSDFKSKREQIAEELKKSQAEMEAHQKKLIQLQNFVAGFGAREGHTGELLAGGSDKNRLEQITQIQKEIEKTRQTSQGLMETFASMGNIGTEETFDKIRKAASSTEDPVSNLINGMRELTNEQIAAAEAAKNWEEKQKELTDMYEETTSVIKNLGRELKAAGLDPQSKQEFDIQVRTEDAVNQIDALIAKFEEARQAALAAKGQEAINYAAYQSIDVNAKPDEAIIELDKKIADFEKVRDDLISAGAKEEEIAAVSENIAKLNKAKELAGIVKAQNDLRRARLQQTKLGADQENEVATKAAQDREDAISDIELKNAQKRNDQWQELALTRQKFEEETQRELEERFTEMDKSTGKKKLRDGAESFKKAREEELRAQLDAINERYAKEQEAKNEEIEDQKKKDQSLIDERLSMELDLARSRKDQAKEIALFQQKWNAETQEKLKEEYTDANGKLKAGAAEFQRLRDEQLQEEIAGINERYKKESNQQDKSKQPIDRAKEMVDIQNEAYQILLKKVQSSKDLFALERALLKIQEMQLANSLKMSGRAVRAETSVAKAQEAYDKALAGGGDTTKEAEALKKASERARIIRGASDLRNRQMGIGTSDVNAMNVASQAMDLTTAAVLQRIGDKMKVIGDALNGMSLTFSTIASTWIDAFIKGWDENSIRMEQAILATLTNLQLKINTAALGGVPGVPTQPSPSDSGPPLPLSSNGTIVTNNFQVTAIDPLEAGKTMARLIDQSTRDL